MEDNTSGQLLIGFGMVFLAAFMWLNPCLTVTLFIVAGVVATTLKGSAGGR